MTQVIKKSLQDIFSFQVIVFVFKIAFIALLFSAPIVWFFEESLASFIRQYLQWIPSMWLQNHGANIIVWNIAYTVFILIVLILTLRRSEVLLIKLAHKHYPHIEVLAKQHKMVSIFITLKSLMIFFMLLMFFMPFLLIPVLGQGIMLYLTSILTRKPIYKIGALFIDDKKILKDKTQNTNTISLLAVLFNYIPFLNIFAPLLRQILFLHHILKK